MLDLPEQVYDSHIHHAIQYLALVLLLVEKGIITDDELDRSRARATQLVDQIVAQQKEEAKNEFKTQHPGVASLFGFDC